MYHGINNAMIAIKTRIMKVQEKVTRSGALTNGLWRDDKFLLTTCVNHTTDLMSSIGMHAWVRRAFEVTTEVESIECKILFFAEGSLHKEVTGDHENPVLFCFVVEVFV